MQDLLGALLLIVVCTGGIGFFAILIVAYFIGAILFAIFNSLVTFGTGEKMSLAPDSTARRSKITEYIHQARAMDMKDAEIKKALIAKGWVQSIVEQELKKKHR